MKGVVCMLSKIKLLDLNEKMCGITFFDENGKMIKDRVGYDVADFGLLKHLLFIPADCVNDEELYMIAITLKRYSNTQLGCKKEIEDTIKHYENLLGIEEDEVKNKRVELKDRNNLNENLNSSCGLSQKICGIKFHFAP